MGRAQQQHLQYTSPLHPFLSLIYETEKIAPLDNSSSKERQINKMSAIQIQQILDSTSEIYSSLKSHSRYSLRLSALFSILIGTVLNFASFLAAFIGFSRGDAPRYLTVWAGVVVCPSSFPVDLLGPKKKTQVLSCLLFS